MAKTPKTASFGPRGKRALEHLDIDLMALYQMGLIKLEDVGDGVGRFCAVAGQTNTGGEGQAA